LVTSHAAFFMRNRNFGVTSRNFILRDSEPTGSSLLASSSVIAWTIADLVFCQSAPFGGILPIGTSYDFGTTHGTALGAALQPARLFHLPRGSKQKPTGAWCAALKHRLSGMAPKKKPRGTIVNDAIYVHMVST
jgi:hypothetical protein